MWFDDKYLRGGIFYVQEEGKRLQCHPALQGAFRTPSVTQPPRWVVREKNSHFQSQETHPSIYNEKRRYDQEKEDAQE